MVTEGEEDREKVSNATIEQIKEEEEEDREKVSNATIEQIKEEEEEEKEINKIKKEEEDDYDEDFDIDPLFNVADDFNERVSKETIEQIKEEEDEDFENFENFEDFEDLEDLEDFDLDLLLDVPDDFNAFMDDFNEFMDSLPDDFSIESEEESEEKAMKRTRIAEPEAAKEAEVRIESDPATDPLEIIMEIVSKYHEFVEFILEMLKEEGKYEEEKEMQRWSKILERGKHLVETLRQRLKRVPVEMERMKNDENLQEEYSFRETHIGDIIEQIRDLNSRISYSPHISFVSDPKFTESALPSCLDELERSKKELSELMEVIIELKGINKESNEENYFNSQL